MILCYPLSFPSTCGFFHPDKLQVTCGGLSGWPFLGHFIPLKILLSHPGSFSYVWFTSLLSSESLLPLLFLIIPSFSYCRNYIHISHGRDSNLGKTAFLKTSHTFESSSCLNKKMGSINIFHPKFVFMLFFFWGGGKRLPRIHQVSRKVSDSEKENAWYGEFSGVGFVAIIQPCSSQILQCIRPFSPSTSSNWRKKYLRKQDPCKEHWGTTVCGSFLIRKFGKWFHLPGPHFPHLQLGTGTNSVASGMTGRPGPPTNNWKRFLELALWNLA